MTRYIAFLKAVNVGGRVVKMEELKKIFAMPGLKNIATYIQSGNVLFDSAETDTALLQKKIEAKLLKALDYEVPVFIKTPDDIRGIIARNPYKKEQPDMNIHVSMLSAEPEADKIALVNTLVAEGEQIKFVATEAYILVPKSSYGTSKLSNVNLEKKLKLTSTTRNWNTMNKVLEL